MDFNQGRTETPDQNEDNSQNAEESSVSTHQSAEPEQPKPKTEDRKPFALPSIPVLQPITNKLKEYKRVIQITKKPDMEEFKTTVKASALGIAIIGAVGFIIAIIAQLLTT